MCCGDLHVNIFTFCAQEKAGASPGGHQRRQRRVQVVIRGGKGESRWSSDSEEAGAWAPKAGGRPGKRPPVQNSGGGFPRKCSLLFASFLSRFAFKKLHWPIGKIKWPKSEEKTDFGGRLGFEPRTPSPRASDSVKVPPAA